MKLFKDYIFKHIEETKFPLWGLWLVQGYKRVPVMFYSGDNFTDSDTPEDKAKKAIQRLTVALEDLPADAVLSIELKNSRTANGSGIIGPFEFVNHSRDDEQTATSAPGFGQFPGLVGLPAPPAGYVSEETLNGRLEALRVANERQINDLIFKQREADFKERMARERAELKEMRKELNDERKKYESNTGAAAETLVFAAKKILGELFPGLKAATAQAATPAQLGAAEPAPEQPTHDPKYNAIERLANALYENPNINENDIQSILDKLTNNNVDNVKMEVVK